MSGSCSMLVNTRSSNSPMLELNELTLQRILSIKEIDFAIVLRHSS